MTVIPQIAKRGRGTANALKVFADRLRTVPGQWCDYPFLFKNTAAASAAARNIRRGCVAFPAGEFEVKKTDDGRLVVRCVLADAAH